MIRSIEQKSKKKKKQITYATEKPETLKEENVMVVQDAQLAAWRESCPLSNSNIGSRLAGLSLSESYNNMTEDNVFVKDMMAMFSEDDVSDLMPNIVRDLSENSLSARIDIPNDTQILDQRTTNVPDFHENEKEVDNFFMI